MTRRVAILLIVLVCVVAAAGTAIFFILRPSRVTHLSVELNTRYYIKAMRNGLFHFPDQYGRPLSGPQHVITLENQDASFAVFENNWRTFRIHFARGTDSVDKNFIVANIRHTGRRGFRATVTQIYDGALQTMHITASGNRLKLSTDATSLVTVSSWDFEASPTYEIIRANTVVLKFALETPSYRRALT